MGEVVDSMSGMLPFDEFSGSLVPLATLDLPTAGTYTIDASAMSEYFYYYFGDSVFGLWFATGEQIIGMDMNVVPTANSVQTVSVDKPTTIEIFGFMEPLYPSAQLDAEVVDEGPGLWVKAAAIRVDEQYHAALAPGAGLPPILADQSLQRTARMMTNQLDKQQAR